MTEVAIEAGIRGVDPAHSSVQLARAEILDDLGHVPELHVKERARRGDGAVKGWETELIAGLTATGTITGLVNVLKLWLGRDRRRSITVKVRTGDQETSYDIAGDSISVDALRDALKAAVESERPPAA